MKKQSDQLQLKGRLSNIRATDKHNLENLLNTRLSYLSKLLQHLRAIEPKLFDDTIYEETGLNTICIPGKSKNFLKEFRTTSNSGDLPTIDSLPTGYDDLLKMIHPTQMMPIQSFELAQCSDQTTRSILENNDGIFDGYSLRYLHKQTPPSESPKPKPQSLPGSCQLASFDSYAEEILLTKIRVN
jgi:hypothetical protein